ncbi:tRNA 2-thiocytidine(32) synthetase TtcA [bacterium]|nr:tRNA 2-thiocytidine(32) synthetase TtcA [bacterium]
MTETFNALKRLRRKLRNRAEKAILDFRMIQPGDRILIAVSGGSDSLSLLQLFCEGFPHVAHDFTFVAVHIDAGFGSKPNILESHLKNLGVTYRIVQTDIASQALNPHAKKNPCFICSMYRRKRIYEIADEESCSKIATGHHKDDMIETLLLNIFYGRKIEAMAPVQPVFQGNLSIIRPFTYIDEDLIKQFAREMELPVLQKHCPMEGNTRREKIKNLIRDVQRDEKNANIRENIFKSFYHVNIDFPEKKSRK